MVEHRHPTEKPHPQPWFYVAVGIILTVITAIEVAVFYLDIAGSLMMPILIGLSVIKFWMVVAFFMHLKYDHKLFTVFFYWRANFGGRGCAGSNSVVPEF